jgi:tRNA pseudouridine55 synthase
MNDTSRMVLVDKPGGITSFGVVSWVRRLMGRRKTGHTGTLDPLATGLMILGVGQGTKCISQFVKLDKTYDVVATLGYATETGDVDGEGIAAQSVEESRRVVSDMADARGVSVEYLICEVVMSLVGINTLPVPAFSSVKKNGRSLHKYARRGTVVDLPVRDMKVYAAEFHAIGEDECGYRTVSFTVDVASGVYVRSLVEEMGKRLGCYAHVRTLRRTRIGEFRVEDAVHPDLVPQRYIGVDFDSK